jgi:Protein of unknown function (DUF3455)
MRWILWLLAVGLVTSLPVQGQEVGSPISVPYPAHAVMRLRGEGVQIYACRLEDLTVSISAATMPGGKSQHEENPNSKAFQWVLLGPDAKLLDADRKQVGTHSAGPMWKLDDGSTVQGELMGAQPSPEAGSVAWLLLRAKAGSASGQFAKVAYIRRTDTHGGSPDKEACRSESDAGKTVRVPYTATYTFYSRN